MSLHRFTGPYPAHYDTPTGSRMVEPGEDVDWNDHQPEPSAWWTDVADGDRVDGPPAPADEAPAADEPPADSPPDPAPKSTSAKAASKSTKE